MVLLHCGSLISHPQAVLTPSGPLTVLASTPVVPSSTADAVRNDAVRCLSLGVVIGGNAFALLGVRGNYCWVARGRIR